MPISAGNFGADLYEAEVRYLVEHEWAVTAEDVLWRRTKRGLHLSREQAAALDEFMRGIKPAPCRGRGIGWRLMQKAWEEA